MDFKDAFVQSGVVFLIVFAIGIVALLCDKHDKGEYDWKGFSKWVFFAFALAIARFVGGYFVGNDF